MLNRRTFLKYTGIGAAVPLIGSVSGCSTISTPKTPPNIVIIQTADMGYGDPECYNPESSIPTPVLNRLADEGMRLTNVYASNSFSAPSRYALLTGRYGWRGSNSWRDFNGYSPAMIKPEHETIASFLAPLGYATACVGMWHLGMGESDTIDFTKPIVPGPNEYGFQYFYGIPGAPYQPPYVYIEQNRVIAEPTDSMAPGYHHDDVLSNVTEKAVEYIGNHAGQTDGQPLFLYAPLPAPAMPWVPSPEFVGVSNAGAYGDYVAQTDAAIGSIIAAIEQHTMTDNTLVIVTSSNGADKRYLDSSLEHDPNGGLRGQKGDAWEGGLRVPCMVKWPGNVTEGSVSDEVVCLTDIFATCATAAGAVLPDNVAGDSFNLLPVICGEPYEKPLRPSIVMQSYFGHYAIRVGDWKLISGQGSGGFEFSQKNKYVLENSQGQLYNLSEDPVEEKDLSLIRWVSKGSGLVMELYNVRQAARTRP